MRASVTDVGASDALHLQVRPRTGALAIDPADLCARILVGTLYFSLAFRLTADFLETARLTGLLLLVSELLVGILNTLRRPATLVDRRWSSRAVTAMSIMGPLCVRPVMPNSVSDDITAGIVVIGLATIIAGQVCLGRSFGVVPANRGVITGGVYRRIRHPIYTGYLIVHVAFVIANPTVWNVLVLTAADLALLCRMRYEERMLRVDPVYVDYCLKTRWRLVPGLY
jgi:hypothetical protein